MKFSKPRLTRRVRPVRNVAVILALAGLSASALAVAPASAATVTVSTAKTPKGTVLESGGATLYVLKGNKTCNAACQKFWPELTLAKGEKWKAGKGVKHAKLSSVKRANGVRQVTYAGKPLYKFVGDHGGSVNGDLTDTWGTWAAVVTAKAHTASHTSPTSGTTTTSGGGSGGGSGGVSF